VIGSARFAPDLQNVIYTAKWEGGDRQTYLLDVNSAQSQVLAFAHGALTSVSSNGDLAFVSRNPGLTKSADSTLNGRELAVVPRGWAGFSGRVSRRERSLQLTCWIDCLRVAFRGDQVALIEHPVRDDDAGDVRVVDRKGNTRVLTDDWSSVEGLA
jgi:hypothetical protein